MHRRVYLDLNTSHWEELCMNDLVRILFFCFNEIPLDICLECMIFFSYMFKLPRNHLGFTENNLLFYLIKLTLIRL